MNKFEKDIEYNELKLFIRNHGKKRELLKNEFVFRINEETEAIYLLESGLVKITQEEENGQNITLSIRKNGEIMGIAEVLSKVKLRERNAFTLTTSTVYIFPAEQLFQYAVENPKIWYILSNIMANRLLETQNFVKILTSKPVQERLAWLLCKYADRNDGRMITNLPLTHEEISYIIGCSRQKVTYYLNEWRKRGIIDYQRGTITILRPDELFLEE